MKRFAACFALLAAVLGNPGETAAQALQKILLLHSQPQITAAFAYSSSLPIHLGYFKEEGLEVEVNPMAGAAAAMQLVVGGRADFAICQGSSAARESHGAESARGDCARRNRTFQAGDGD